MARSAGPPLSHVPFGTWAAVRISTRGLFSMVESFCCGPRPTWPCPPPCRQGMVADKKYCQMAVCHWPTNTSGPRPLAQMLVATSASKFKRRMSSAEALYTSCQAGQCYGDTCHDGTHLKSACRGRYCCISKACSLGW